MVFAPTKQPPAIRHYPYRPSGYRKMIEHVSRVVGLGKRAEKLQMLYADSSEGFRPALKCIEDRTGIKANKVSEIRKEIFDHGLMAYTNCKDVLLLDWGRIASFATFDHPIFEKGQYRPIELGVKKNEHTAIRNAPGYHKPHASPDRTEEPWEQEYFDRLASMSIREYKDVFQPMTASEKAAKDQAISEEAYMKLIDVRAIDFYL